MNIFIAHIDGKNAVLTADESWHCTKVLRKKTGDNIALIDGKGNYYSGTLRIVNEKQSVANITSGPKLQPAKNYHLHLAIAPTKQIDRIEWMLEKAVEIGITEVSLLLSKNSERKVVKTERLQKIAESAVKQSLQAFIPKINEATTFDYLIGNVGTYNHKLIAHCFEEPKLPIHRVIFKNNKSLVLIGPEGDFTREEVNMAVQAGFTSLSLGDNRLRTETAGLYVCQAASLLSS